MYDSLFLLVLFSNNAK